MVAQPTDRPAVRACSRPGGERGTDGVGGSILTTDVMIDVTIISAAPGRPLSLQRAATHRNNL